MTSIGEMFVVRNLLRVTDGQQCGDIIIITSATEDGRTVQPKIIHTR